MTLLNEKPACVNNLTPKGLPLKAQTGTKKEMGALRKGGVFEPPKKAVKLIFFDKGSSSQAYQEGLFHFEQERPYFGK